MISYQEACDSVGFDKSEKSPAKQYEWLSYVSGKVATHKSKEAAYLRSKLVERVILNQDECTAWKSHRKSLESLAFAAWHKALKASYLSKDLNEAVFNTCYDLTYESCHKDGFDAIAEGMESTITFAKNILKASKQG